MAAKKKKNVGNEMNTAMLVRKTARNSKQGVSK